LDGNVVLTVPVSLVVPVLNEEESISELLDALVLQTIKPAEVIFCDAGSSDRTVEIIQRWWKGFGWEGGSLKVLIRPNAFPGAGRNFGVKAAHESWIAFIDAGIVPERNWLENLHHYATVNNLLAVFGLCKFVASAAIPRAVCALSYGYCRLVPVVPASLFHRSVFDLVGYFQEDLRATEDMVWVKRIKKLFGHQDICREAIVVYSHFPKSFRSVARKWFITQKCSLFSGVRIFQLTAYTLIFFGMGILSIFKPSLFLLLVLMYLVFRGCIDPWRRSGWRNWWQGEPKVLLVIIPIMLIIDFAKVFGIFSGIMDRLRNKSLFNNVP
jgi:glycosyltransferase involved in cell wall biosynthesis